MRKWPTRSTRRTARRCGCSRIWTRRAGDLDAAAARLTEQLRRYPSDSDWGLRYELAAVLDRLGQYDAAWTALCQAKSQLAPQAADHLRDSYFIRRRQWELTQVGHPGRSAALATGGRLARPAEADRLSDRLSPLGHDAARTDHRLVTATRSTRTSRGSCNGQFIEPLVWKADDALSAIIELRSFDAEQLIAGRETFFQLTENYLDQPIGERLLDREEPVADRRPAAAVAIVPGGIAG